MSKAPSPETAPAASGAPDVTPDPFDAAFDDFFATAPVWGERARRRRGRRRRRRVVQASIVGAVLVAVAMAVVLRDGGAPEQAVPRTGAERPARTLPDADSVLLAQRGDDGRVVSLFALAPGRRAGTGLVLLVPPGTMTEVPAFGAEPLARAPQLGDDETMLAAAANLIGLPLDHVVVTNDAGLGALVRAAGPLILDVPERVERVRPDGGVEVLWEAGPATITSDEAPSFLSARAKGNDLARLARHQVFWRAWLDRMRERRAAIPSANPVLAATLGSLARSRADVVSLPVEVVAARGPDGELYKARVDELGPLLRASLPGAAPPVPEGTRARVQVLNGTGGLGLAASVTRRLQPAGVRVTLTDNADRLDHDVTQVVFYDARWRAAAERVRAALGVGEVALGRRPLGVVDLTVVVGRDYVR